MASQLAGLQVEQLMLELHGRASKWLPLLRDLSAANFTLWHVEEGRYIPDDFANNGTKSALIVMYLWKAVGGVR